MLEAYALNKNIITQEMFKKGLKVFYGCFLDGAFCFRNMDYDLFAMHIKDIEFIEKNYKNGGKFPIKVYFNNNEDDFMVGVFYYWFVEHIGNRGLIASEKNEMAKQLYERRATII